MVPNKNIGAAVQCLVAGAGRALADGTGDAAKVTGQTIDRMPPGEPGSYSCVLAIAAGAVLSEDETLSMAVEAQYTDTPLGSWDTAVVLQAAAVLLTGGAGGSSEIGNIEIDVSFATRKRYVRFNVTPNLSAVGTVDPVVAATDVCHWGATCVLGGATDIPV